MNPIEQLAKLEHINGQAYKDKVSELEKIFGVTETNPFKTSDTAIFADRLEEMTYADMQSLAMRVGLSPYLLQPQLKKALLKECRAYNLNAKGKMLPLTATTLKLDSNNPKHKKTLEILGEMK